MLCLLEDKAEEAAIQYELLLEIDDGTDMGTFDATSDSFMKRVKERALRAPEMRTATMIRVVNASDEALFLPGISAPERIWRLHLVTFMYVCLLGDGAMSPHGGAAASSLGGFATSVFKAFATNASSLTQALAARSPTQQDSLPPPWRMLLRAWAETDDLEIGFSRLLACAGWKGDAEQMRRIGARSEYQAAVRRNSDRGFSLTKSAKSPKEHAEFHASQLERWWQTDDVEWERAQRWKKFREGLAHALPKISTRSYHAKR
jgi:hypothetical protein